MHLDRARIMFIRSGSVLNLWILVTHVGYLVGHVIWIRMTGIYRQNGMKEDSNVMLQNVPGIRIAANLGAAHVWKVEDVWTGYVIVVRPSLIQVAHHAFNFFV